MMPLSGTFSKAELKSSASERGDGEVGKGGKGKKGKRERGIFTFCLLPSAFCLSFLLPSDF